MSGISLEPDEDIVSQTTTAVEVIRIAADLVGGERAKQHGDKRKNHQHIADFWNAYLGERLTAPIRPVDVAWMMTLLKIARTKSGSLNIDNAVDAVGYAGIAGELME